MNCFNHPESQAVAYCRACGKAMCATCQRNVEGILYCEEHAPARSAAAPPDSPWTAPGPSVPSAAAAQGSSPALAFILGLIPGVGAIYNGQYAKGIVHVIVLGLLISIVNSDATGGLEPLFGLLIALWFFYMAFEAYHTAKLRAAGAPIDEFSSLFPLRHTDSRFPVAPLVLIALGIIFLLNNMGIIRLYQLLRYWPVFLIILGAYMLYARISDSTDAAQVREASDER